METSQHTRLRRYAFWIHGYLQHWCRLGPFECKKYGAHFKQPWVYQKHCDQPVIFQHFLLKRIFWQTVEH